MIERITSITYMFLIEANKTYKLLQIEGDHLLIDGIFYIDFIWFTKKKEIIRLSRKAVCTYLLVNDSNTTTKGFKHS